MAQIEAIWFCDISHEINSVRNEVNRLFIFVQDNKQVLRNKIRDSVIAVIKSFGRLIHNYEIINIAAVILTFQFVLNKLIKHIKINITKELACKVPYRKPLVSRTVPQAFVGRKQVKFPLRRLNNNIILRVMIDNLPYQFPQPRFRNPFNKQFIENIFVYGNKKILQVRLEVISFFCVIVRNSLGVFSDFFGSVQRTSSGDTAESILNKSGIKPVFNRIIHKVVNNSIPERGSPNFTRLGFEHDKTDTYSDFIFTGFQLIIKLHHIRLQVKFKFHSGK